MYKSSYNICDILFALDIGLLSYGIRKLNVQIFVFYGAAVGLFRKSLFFKFIKVASYCFFCNLIFRRKLAYDYLAVRHEP